MRAGGAAEINNEMATTVGKSTALWRNGIWIIPRKSVSMKKTKRATNEETANALYGRQSVTGVLGCMPWARYMKTNESSGVKTYVYNIIVEYEAMPVL